MAKSKTKVSVVIVNLNNKNLLNDVLKDLENQDLNNIDLDIVLVDNASNKETVDFIRNLKTKFYVEKVLLNENTGFAKGNNIGIQKALKRNCDYIVLLNNDMVLSRGLIKSLTSFMDQNEDVGMASPKIYFAKGFEYHKDRYNKNDLGKVFWYAGGDIDWKNIYTSHHGVDEVDKGQYEKVSVTDVVNCACAIIKSEVFKKIGFFDEKYYLYWEDADLTQRAKRSGYRTVYYPNTQAWHKVSQAAGGQSSFSNDYFLIRNRYFFALKYANLRAKIAVIRDTFRLMFAGRTWQKMGAKDALLGIGGKGSWK